MTVPKTNFILRMDESSGTTMTNNGTTPGDYTMGSTGSPVEGVDYAWPGGGPLLGRFQGITVGSTKQPWFSTAATTPGTSKQTINVMAAFNVSDVPSSGLLLTMLCGPRGDPDNGDVSVYLNNESGSNFDCVVKFVSSTGRTISYTYATLSKNTNYIVAASLDVTTTSAVVGKASLNGAAAQTLTGSAGADDWSGGSDLLQNNWPYLFRRNDFAQYAGIIGYGQGWAYSRGGVAWTGSELASISADPSFIEGWTTAGGGSLMGQIPARPKRTFFAERTY